tara:strand:+ start:125 stop:1183 length:1059 start_codon:yes stop_codon:yes gene_type:complete
MASTYTTRLRLEKQATGENANTWGDKTNVNFELIDESINGYASKSVAGSSNVTLTNSNATSDESRQSVLEFTGTLTGSINVLLPTTESRYIVYNNTAGSYNLTVATTGNTGTGTAVVQGSHALMYSNGTFVKDVFSTGINNLTCKGTLNVAGAVSLDGGSVTINESSADVDFRVESNGSTHALFVDGGNNRVGILNATPGVALDVTGAITASTTITGNLFSGSGKDVADTVPTGGIIIAGFAAEPTKSDDSTKRYLLCNAQAVSRSTYSALFSAISTTYGVGDGSSTFNLPDLQGRVPMGSGSGSGLTARTLGATGGTENTAAGGNIASGANYSYSIVQPFSVVNFFIATGK